MKRLLKSNTGRFNIGDFAGNHEARFVYLQEQARAGVRQEAEADLVHGFRAWLQGTHAENLPGRTDKYENKADGRPHRRRMDGTRYPDEKTDWQSTPWGDAQLTHLPGVREWLRENAIATDKADLEMKLLAEYGPHDLETAWKYYKHWVLKRPISYLDALNAANGPGLRSDVNKSGWVPRRSTHFDALPPPPDKRPGRTPTTGTGEFATPSTPSASTSAESRAVSTAYRPLGTEFVQLLTPDRPEPDYEVPLEDQQVLADGLFTPPPGLPDPEPARSVPEPAPEASGILSYFSSFLAPAQPEEPERRVETPKFDEAEWQRLEARSEEDFRIRQPAEEVPLSSLSKVKWRERKPTWKTKGD
jgi:hypothetical protein